MTRDLVDRLKELTTDETIFKLNALAYKKTYDALVAEGFTPEMAVRIVASRGHAGVEEKQSSLQWG